MLDACLTPHLARLLSARVRFMHVRSKEFPEGYTSRSEVIPSYRFILITRGELNYEIQDVSFTLNEGTACFVPSWAWRQWSVLPGKTVSLLWAVFSSNEGIFPFLQSLLFAQPDDFETLVSRLDSVRTLWEKAPREELLLEAEFKAILTRFFYAVPKDDIIAQMEGGAEGSEKRHPEIEHAIHWLQTHYAHPAALAELQEQLSLNPDYFRSVFRKQMHQNPNQYLTTLRMRAARYLIMESSMSIKEIAQQSGYTDPQYFSRTYKSFWKRSPSEERVG